MAYSIEQLKQLVINSARKYGIDEKIALAQINQESGFRVNANSGKALGIAQFTPGTAARFNLKDRTNPFESMRAWGEYMTFLLRRYGGDYKKALAAYNAGEGNVDKYDGIPPFKETQNYVKTILQNAYGAVSDVFSGSGSDSGAAYQNASLQPASMTPKPVSPETKRAVILVAAGLTILVALTYAFD